jgi:hypothetical protein
MGLIDEDSWPNSSGGTSSFETEILLLALFASQSRTDDMEQSGELDESSNNSTTSSSMEIEILFSLELDESSNNSTTSSSMEIENLFSLSSLDEETL